MSATHHPPPELLAGFAAGALDAGEHLVVAVHVAGCSTCRRLVRALERAGGATLMVQRVIAEIEIARAEPAALVAKAAPQDTCQFSPGMGMLEHTRAGV
jgi:putative transcriptional regulator